MNAWDWPRETFVFLFGRRGKEVKYLQVRPGHHAVSNFRVAGHRDRIARNFNEIALSDSVIPHNGVFGKNARHLVIFFRLRYPKIFQNFGSFLSRTESMTRDIHVVNDVKKQFGNAKYFDKHIVELIILHVLRAFGVIPTGDTKM